MPLEVQIEHIPLSKHRLLEFLGRQTGPVTAKVASIDLDTRLNGYGDARALRRTGLG